MGGVRDVGLFGMWGGKVENEGVRWGWVGWG